MECVAGILRYVGSSVLSAYRRREIYGMVMIVFFHLSSLYAGRMPVEWQRVVFVDCAVASLKSPHNLAVCCKCMRICIRV